MSIIRKARIALEVMKEDGFQGIMSILIVKYWPSIPGSTKFRWRVGIRSEIRFTDAWFRTKGWEWPEDYKNRLDPDFPLQPILAALLPPQMNVDILDVGAGPLTYVGKKCGGKHITITAIDALADEYDKILDKYRIGPFVRTQKLAVEILTTRFHPNTFDLVCARNCIDHAYNPERAILQMLDVVKIGGYVLLQHRPNEGAREHYSGLHQWNFSISADGDFLLSSRFGKKVNMTKKYAELSTTTCEIVHENDDNDWLITRIQKR